MITSGPIPGGPIEDYLRQLRRQLPYPAPRLIAETREHLMEAASVSLAAGFSHRDAEARAVQGYGPVPDVVAAVLNEGSALMSPRIVRWLAPLAVLMCLPTFVFVSANVIETLAGNDGGYGVFGSTFDAWRTQINALLVFGPMVAFALIILASLRFQREKVASGFAVTIELRMSKWTFRAAAIATVVVAAVVAYGITENFSTWRDFHNQNWTCTTTDTGQQVCYQGNSLGEP